MPKLNIYSQVLAYQDSTNASAPLERYFDWKKSVAGVDCEEVFAERHNIPAGTTQALEDLLSAQNITPATVFSVSEHPSKSGVYQIWYQSGAVVPGVDDLDFFTSDIAAVENYTITVDAANGTIDLAATATPFACVPGDVLYLPGSEFDDSGPWAAANQGFWEVVSLHPTTADDLKVRLRRVDDTYPNGSAEVVAAASATDIQRQTGIPYRWVYLQGQYGLEGLFEVVQAAKGWLAVEATPSTFDAKSFTKMLIAKQYASWVRLECDQPISLTINGGTADLVVTPVVEGTPGWFEHFGFIFSLSFKNVGKVEGAVNAFYVYGKASA